MTYRERRAITLTGDLSTFARLVSPQLSAHQSVRVYKEGVVETLPGLTTLIEQHTESRELIFVLSGRVSIFKNDESIGSCGAGTFIGEIGFLTDEPHTATVKIESDQQATVLRWDPSRLKKFAKTRPNLYVALQQCLAANLSKKFTRREQLRLNTSSDFAATGV